jgi:hypothetical protein
VIVRPASLRYNAYPWVTSTTPLRGCAVCDHGKGGGALCGRLKNVYPSHTEHERAQGGACGPDAKFLTIKGTEP